MSKEHIKKLIKASPIARDAVSQEPTYAVVTSHVYNRNHRQARQRVKKYNHNLTRLLKMYEKERK